jgi:integrase
MRLTEINIRAFAVETGQRTFFDDTLKGFGVRVSQGGTKTYVLMHGKDRKLITLGRVGIVDLKDARNKARHLLATKQLSTGEAEEPTLTFKAACNTFLAMHVKPNNKTSTAAETERLLIRHFASLEAKPITKLKTGDFTEIIDGLIAAGTLSEANHAFTAVKTMLRFCLGRGYIDRHPLEALKRPVEARNRDRWLTDAELRKVLATAANFRLYGLLIQILLLTGQRLGQIANLRRDWIEGDTIRFPASVMKSGHEHVVPTGEWTQALLAMRNTALLFENEDGKPYNNYGNGSALVSPSRRTGVAGSFLLRESLSSTPGLIWDGIGQNPYYAFLAVNRRGIRTPFSG